MLLVAFVQWWYGPGWLDAASRLRTRISETYYMFSVPILIPTMFAPWKRIITYPGRGIEAQFRAGIDNLISRVIGFLVRLFALGAAVVIMGVYLVFGGALLAIWVVAPILGPVLVVWGII